MLTQDQVYKIISEIESENNIRRKRHAFNSELVRTGGLKPFVESRVKQMYPKTHSMYTIADYSISKRINDKKAKAYKESPIRKIIGDEAAGAIYSELTTKYDLDSAMKCFDEIYNENKYSLMASFMDRQPVGAVEKYLFKFFALAPYEFDVILDDMGDLKVVVLSYPSKSVTAAQGDSTNFSIAEPGKGDEGSEVRKYAFWTNEQHFMVNVSGYKENIKMEVYLEEGMNGLNPYGVLPFSYAPKDRSENYPNLSPLASQTVEFNALMSVYLTSANMQVGILKITRPESQKLSIASHSLYTAIEVPQSSRPEDKASDIDFISPSPNMAGHKEAIETYLKSILDEQGITSSQMLNANENFSSGFDRLLSMADVQSIIEENQKTYSKVEHDIYIIVRAQLLSVGIATLPEEGFKVTYRKPTILLSDKEKLDNLKAMKDLGLWSDWELVQMYDPNLSADEAKNKLLAIQNEKVEFANTFTDPSKVFNGAQVASIVEVSTKVGVGQLTYEAGVQILVTSFGIPEEVARTMVPVEGSVSVQNVI